MYRIIGACLMLTIAAPTAEAALFGSGATYKGFKGKFIDQAVKRKPVSGASGNTAAPRGIAAAAALGDVWDAMPNAKAEAYLNGIAGRLQAKWTGNKRPVKITLTADSSYRAAAWPDGTIRVARGVLRDAETEDEIAALLGHEIAHVLLDHFARAEVDEARSQAISGAAGAATMGLVLSNTTVRQGGGGQAQMGLKNQAGVQKDVEKTLLIKAALDQSAEMLLNSPWRREQEDEADLLAIDLAYSAGYSANAIKPVLQRTKAAEVKAKSRVEQLQQQYQTALAQQSRSGNLQNIQNSVMNALGGVVLAKAGDIRDFLTRTHPDIDDRIEDTDAYIAREYELAALHRTRKDALSALVNAADTKAVLRNYDKAEEAMVQLGGAGGRQALALATDGSKEPTASHPFTLQALAKAQLQSGGFRVALATMTRAAASPSASYSTILYLASLNQLAGNYAAAESDIKRAGARFGSAEITYPALIQLYGVQRNVPKVQETYAACLKVKSREIVGQCNASVGLNQCFNPADLACRVNRSANDVGDRIVNGGKSLFGK